MSDKITLIVRFRLEEGAKAEFVRSLKEARLFGRRPLLLEEIGVA
jgi:hypothetical protein